MSRIQQIQEMLKNDPSDSFLNYALALEHAKLGEIKKAIIIIESILNNDPNYLGGYYQLGKYYEQLGETTKALDTYQKGMVIAQEQKNQKAEGELSEALWILED